MFVITLVSVFRLATLLRRNTPFNVFPRATVRCDLWSQDFFWPKTDLWKRRSRTLLNLFLTRSCPLEWRAVPAEKHFWRWQPCAGSGVLPRTQGERERSRRLDQQDRPSAGQTDQQDQRINRTSEGFKIVAAAAMPQIGSINHHLRPQLMRA